MGCQSQSFSEKGHLLEELLECISLLFKEIPREENSIATLKSHLQLFHFVGNIRFKIFLYEKLPARKDDPG